MAGMDEGYDLSDIPLVCDQTSLDLDFSSDLPVTPAKECEDFSNVTNLGDAAKISANLFEEDTDSMMDVPNAETKDQEYSMEDIVNSIDRQEINSLIELEEKDTANDEAESSFHISSTVNDNATHTKETPSETSEIEETELQGKRPRTEEEMKLREFDVLDEVGPYDDNEGFDEDSFTGGMYDDYDDDYLSEDEIDAMLEEGLEGSQPKKKIRLDNEETETESENNALNVNSNAGETENGQEFTKRQKVVMVEKVKDHFEVLPDGWVVLTHNSGMPLYLHRASRVCTLSKPYFLGPGSARKHNIPLSAIPCLEYRRAQEEEEAKKQNENEKPNTLIVNGTEIPNARIETAQENEESRQLTPGQLKEYCGKLFEFKTISVMRFKSWIARRNFTKNNRSEKPFQRPTLPKDTKLITCPIRQTNSDGKAGRPREWIMNPNGKSYVCILHEYVQRALKDQPAYKFKELENTATPYLAIVSIGGIQYGKGFGSSKKQAKHDAAKNTLEILIPEMKDKIDEDKRLWGRAGNSKSQTDLSFFDGIKIEDPRVTEFCVKTTEPLPHAILLTCLQRNFGMSETHIKCETTPLKHSKNEFKMTVGQHTATVICQNKRDGKQKASQVILQKLHPHVPSWGSLLRLYGNTSVKTMKEKKIEEQEITLLQSRGTSHSPNYAILNKLKEEMKKFKAMKQAIRPIRKFDLPDDIDLPTESGCDLSNVVL